MTASAAQGNLVAVSRQMTQVLALARRAAESDAKVLVTGESGVGKELVAREIYAQSSRAERPLLTINCAGLAEPLLESELFGHTRGSFTGAFRDRPGKLELADGATLFLDEVGEMSLHMQALLLRFLENGETQRVGDERRAIVVDARVIASTNRDLEERIASGHFREDLVYRLRVISIHIPPLRTRPDDIRALVHRALCLAHRPVTLSSETMRALLQYRWPGNVRELQNVVEQAIWLTERPVIEIENLPARIRATPETVVTRERRTRVADHLFDALVSGSCSFWGDVYPLFRRRDLTRQDVRELVKRGLAMTRGSYRGLVALFGMSPDDYQRFHNFLAAHDCKVAFKGFRSREPLPASWRLSPIGVVHADSSHDLTSSAGRSGRVAGRAVR